MTSIDSHGDRYDPATNSPHVPERPGPWYQSATGDRIKPVFRRRRPWPTPPRYARRRSLVLKEDLGLEREFVEASPIAVSLANTSLFVQSTIEGAADRNAYDERAGVRSKHYLTILDPRDTDWIVARVRDRIAGRVVVEIGAGVGVLACEIARYARRVFAIEADLGWTWTFARHLYQIKPANLTFIADSADNLVDVLRADVAIVVTGSDEDNLRALAGRFAPEVILPWQDWNDGRAIVGWSPFGGAAGPVCNCMFGCVVDGANGVELKPRERCQLRVAGAISS